MPYEIHTAPGEEPVDDTIEAPTSEGWPMWEVFVRARRGMSHAHAGSLHAPDPETALQHARDVYTRRREGVSVWVVPSDAITASDPDDGEALFESIEKPYRHATYYEIPDEVGHM
jgi:ring-1,2-phenylacetyl-CoA epoxidase subunit PaaB